MDYTHGQLRELMTNYGKIDILWYDMPVPLDAQGWRSAEMNDMVLQASARYPGEQSQPVARRFFHTGAIHRGDQE